jgi:signal transduction histidine kinase
MSTSTPTRSFASILRLAGICAWVAVSLPTFLRSFQSPRFPFWLAAWIAFGATFAVAARLRPASPAFWLALGTQVAAVVVMVALLCNGYEGTYLALVAAQLGLLSRPRLGLAWIFLQTLALAITIGVHWGPRPAWLLAPPYLGFEILTFATFHLIARERAARNALAQSNEELLRLQGRLAERSRLDERLRIAQELHDALGHHLTAMSLSLEVAAHQTEGEARDSVRTAQSLVRHVLGDVRGIVRSMKETHELDLVHELERLAREVRSPRIHIRLAGDAPVADAERSHALLRCVQEIVTNAIRHGQAQNVWIELRRGGGDLELQARDDGRGASEIRTGQGLAGMRQRLEELGGTLAFESRDGGGFALRATLPLGAGSSG